MAAPTRDNLKLFKAATMASSFSTANPGGAISATQITGGAPGEVFFAMEAYEAGSGSGTRTQYSNIKYTMDGTTGGLLVSPSIYLANSLDDVTSHGLITALSSSASDDNTKYLNCYMINNANVAVVDPITLNGTSLVTGAQDCKAGRYLLVVELRLVSGGALTTAAGDITIKQGSQVLGIIPAGLWSAIGCVLFGIDATLNTTTTIATAAAAPGGISFAKPNTLATATALPADLEEDDYITIWPRLQLPEGALPMPDWQMDWRMKGSASTV